VDERALGILIAALGLAAVVVGVLVAVGALSWFGHLPGDIRWSSGATRVYIPITTMIIISVVLSLIAYLAGRLR
jgi:hypothetical protein